MNKSLTGSRFGEGHLFGMTRKRKPFQKNGWNLAMTEPFLNN